MKYVVNMVSKHEEAISVVGVFDTKEGAEVAMSQDIEETANGFDNVSREGVYVEDHGDWTGKVSYGDNCFLWAINAIDI